MKLFEKNERTAIKNYTLGNVCAKVLRSCTKCLNKCYCNFNDWIINNFHWDLCSFTANRNNTFSVWLPMLRNKEVKCDIFCMRYMVLACLGVFCAAALHVHDFRWVFLIRNRVLLTSTKWKPFILAIYHFASAHYGWLFGFMALQHLGLTLKYGNAWYIS